MDHLLAMRVFARVVEAGSFTRAAASLQMPKATVTKLVQGLEAHLRVQLLERTTRRVAVTADGAAYYEQTGRLLGELDEIETTLSNAQKSPRGKLRVDLGGTTASIVVIPALPRFYALYPDIELVLEVSDRAADEIGDNIDCVIRGTAYDVTHVSRELASIRWVTCASPGYLERHGAPQHPRDLEGDHFVVTYVSPRAARPMVLQFERDGESLAIRGRCRLGVNDSNAHLAAGAAGLGVLQALECMARPYLERGELVPVLTDWQRPSHPIYLGYPQNRHLSAKLRVFVDWVAALFAAAP
ncbi:LysR family transcriptional regulator [Nannocystis punicea]|uniref:LysR substrate-binding domain-containing protein n=1 Tax=Nannocystis punicea TaxID=2995304 RepID=A0ABY7H690_9BACT|nr:LysR family transcriptional regulator [Nannocystis poenicansa]WAS94585.1 LysR substrate-binding domain-containing protein [Nannocystis poenicansa]